MKLQILDRWSGRLIFEHDIEENTMLATIKAAIASRANLSRANLSGANLSGANLSGADLSGANLSGANLSGANLYGANLYGANLSRANLSRANLSRANLSGANLSGADLSGANLSRANLSGANLYGANLYGANLYGANLYGANLYGANLYGADLYGANLYGANLSGADLKEVANAALVLAQTQITPSEGAFVGWKKLRDGVIAKLVIPHDALRFNSYGSRKCRASKVFVHEMYDASGAVFTGTGIGMHDKKTTYTTGQETLPDRFCEDKQQECSNGIHFFMTREEAAAY
jgi:hypothetical protein